jgi:hypothetical protein
MLKKWLKTRRELRECVERDVAYLLADYGSDALKVAIIRMHAAETKGDAQAYARHWFNVAEVINERQDQTRVNPIYASSGS